MDRSNLPVVPATVLQKYQIAVRTDDRFRAFARLLQAIWREQQGFAAGERVNRQGVITPLGSKLADGEATGSNFLTPEIAQLAWDEAAYREPGAVIDESRLWTNLLASQPLTFNALGLMKLDLTKATAFIRAMIDDLADAEATGILFEHSPGRGDPALTGDHTAFDAVITYKRQNDRTGFIALELKYTETLRGSPKVMRTSIHAAMVASKLYKDASDASLHKPPLQQIAREHILAQTSLKRGDYDEGQFIVVYPTLNVAIGAACARYAEALAEAEDFHVRFSAWTLESVAAGLRQSISSAYADAFEARYLNWQEVQKVIDSARPAVPVKRLTDRRKR